MDQRDFEKYFEFRRGVSEQDLIARLLFLLFQNSQKTEVARKLGKLKKEERHEEMVDTLTDQTDELESQTQVLNKIQSVLREKDVDLTPVLEALAQLQKTVETKDIEIPELDTTKMERLLQDVVSAIEDIEEPDTEPLEKLIKKGSEDTVKAIKGIKIPKQEKPVVKVPEKVKFDKPKWWKDYDDKDIKKAIETLIETVKKKKTDFSKVVEAIEALPKFSLKKYEDADGRLKVNVDRTGGGGSINVKAQTLTVVIDETSTTGYFYLGKAHPGAKTTDAVWQISKFQENLTEPTVYPNGNEDFKFIWNNRTSLTYS
jgi:hypothetical protein